MGFFESLSLFNKFMYLRFMCIIKVKSRQLLGIYYCMFSKSYIFVSVFHGISF